MSTPNKETVRQLETEIKKLRDEDPCKALKKSRLIFSAKGWLPKFKPDELSLHESYNYQCYRKPIKGM